MLTETEQQTIKDFLNLAHRTGNEVKDFMVEEIIFEHRTHQQSIVRTLGNSIAEYGVKNNGSDLRNEGAVKFACGVKDMLESGNFYLPYV